MFPEKKWNLSRRFPNTMIRPVFLLILFLALNYNPVFGQNSTEKFEEETTLDGNVLIDELGCTDCHTIEGILGRVHWKSEYTHKKIILNQYNSFPVHEYQLPMNEAQKITEFLERVRLNVVASIALVPRKLANIENPDQLVQEGREVYDRLGCKSCHIIDGNGFEKGPDLSTVGSRLKPGWMYIWMKSPKIFFPNTPMPSFPYSDEELLALVGYLSSLKGNLPDLPYKGEPVDSKWTAQGKKLVRTIGCKRCHIIDGKGGFFAPDLSYTGDKVQKEWLYQFLKDPFPIRPEGPVIGAILEEPTENRPIVRMPYLFLSEDQLRGLVEYLSSLTFARSN